MILVISANNNGFLSIPKDVWGILMHIMLLGPLKVIQVRGENYNDFSQSLKLYRRL